ncbi:MAG: DUF6443 domain-containing protein [Flavobacteriales bacterium]|nr:DUF6443 domain-containing protein [Flavobacteriales bacterium]
MKSIRKAAIFIYLITFISFHQSVVFSQTNLEDHVEWPVSPEASGFLKFGDVPVSTYTGIPQINIPLTEIQTGDLSIPVSISYHGSGIKVNEESSSVGLGWMLNVGGAITQSIRGLDDRQGGSVEPSGIRHIPNFPLMNPGGCGYCVPFDQGVYPTAGVANYYHISPFFQGATWQWSENGVISSENFADLASIYDDNIMTNIDGYLEGSYDWESDLYSFNFLNYSGKFVFDELRNIVQLDQSDLKIEKGNLLGYPAPEDQQAEGFTIVSPEGHKFFFGAKEETRPQPYSANISNVISRTFYLSSILSYNGDFVSFEYDEEPVVTNLDRLNQSVYALGVSGMGQTGASQGIQNSYSVTEFRPRLLRRIVYNDDTVEIYRTSRVDYPGVKRIVKIERRKNNQVLKSLDFHQSYFTSSDVYGNYLPTPVTQTFLDKLSKRLRLDSISEYAGDLDSLRHTFDYNTLQMPYKTSLAVDYWGYFNGVTSNTHLIPDFSRYYVSDHDPATWLDDPINTTNWNGADRNPNEAYSKMAILEKVTYPTGGSSQFEFELHDYSNTKYENKHEFLGKKSALAVDINYVNADDPFKSFTISGEPQIVEFNVYLSCVDGVFCPDYHPSTSGDAPKATLVKISGQTTVLKTWGLQDVDANGNVKERILLDPGVYSISASLPDAIGQQQGLSQIEASYSEYGNEVFLWKGGGHRISSIRTHDGLNSNNDVIKRYQYHFEEETNGVIRTKSYGMLHSQPKFMNVMLREYHQPRVYDMDGIWVTGGLNEIGKKSILSSNSFRPMIGTEGGSMIGYSQVEEWYGANAEHGKKVFKYLNNENIGNSYNGKVSAIPDIQNPFNGLLIRESTVSTDGDTVLQVVNEYDTANTKIIAMVHKEHDQPNAYNNTDDVCLRCMTYLHYYYDLSSRVLLKSSTTTQDGVSFTKEVEYDQSFAHNLPVRETITHSDGTKNITEMTYVADFPCFTSCAISGSELDDVHKLFKSHLIHKTVEKTEYLQKPNWSMPRAINSQFFNYDEFQTGFNHMDNIQLGGVTLLNTNVPLLNFSKVQVGSNDNFIIDNHYENAEKFQFEYDEYGNFIQYQQRDGEPVSFMWDQDLGRPMANINYASANECAYTSFENGNHEGGWTFTDPSPMGFVGEHSKWLTQSSVSKSNIQQGSYILSFWYKTNNIEVELNNQSLSSLSGTPEWQKAFIELEATQQMNTLVIYGSGQIDELRLHPKYAEMETINFDNKGNIVASIDANNDVNNRYEYDAFGRLLLIRDIDSNITQSYDYHYDHLTAVNEISSREVQVAGIKDIQDLSSLDVGQNIYLRRFSDGLGRDIQNIVVEGSPSKKDLVSFASYNDQGREVKKYKSFSTLPDGGTFKPNISALQNNYYSNTNAFEEIEFEEVPLDRTSKIAAAGPDWAMGSGHEISQLYRANLSNEVRYFESNGVSTGFWPPNSLNVSQTLNENGESVISYVNTQGKEILKNKEGLLTYFVYDDFGMLKFVIPPKTVENMNTSGNFNCNLPLYQDAVFSYAYDDQHRIIRKKIPGKSTEFLYYDRLDRLVLTKDGNQNQTFTKYNKKGKPIITGIYTGNNLPNPTNDLYEQRSSANQTGYTLSNSFPTSQIEVYSVTYYDNYDFNLNGQVDNDESFISSSSSVYDEFPKQQNVGNITGSKLATFEEDGVTIGSYLKTRTFYNRKNEEMLTVSDNVTGEQDLAYKKHNFTGKVTHERIQHRANLGSLQSKILEKEYVFDHQNRLTKTYFQIDGGVKQLLSKLDYNDQNLIIARHLGGINEQENKYLQDVNYTYDLHDRMVSINDPDDCLELTIGDEDVPIGNGNIFSDVNNPNEEEGIQLKSSNDIFSLKYYYNTFKAGLSITPQYNGNINAVEYRDGCDQIKQGYGFEYDNHGRIVSANFARTNLDGDFHQDDRYNLQNVSYDENGNLLALERNGLSGNLMDNFSYSVSLNNRLLNLTELGDPNQGYVQLNSNGFYDYDDNGNMTRDNGREMDIHYTHKNLPRVIAFDNLDSIRNHFDASGSKHISESKGSGHTNWSQKLYIGEFTYNNGTLESIKTPSGRAVPNNNGSFDFEYVISDNVGNARVSFSDKDGNGKIEEEQGEILQRNHYYPFGMQMDGHWKQVHGIENEFKYNGKELHADFGLNWYDYGARWYEPALGKWHSIDPLAENFLSLSPYTYSYNDPIQYFDPDGAAPEKCCNGNAPKHANWNQYTLKKGETLGSLAKREYTTVAEIMKWNPQINDADKVYAGETLNLVGGEGPPPDAFATKTQTVDHPVGPINNPKKEKAASWKEEYRKTVLQLNEKYNPLFKMGKAFNGLLYNYVPNAQETGAHNWNVDFVTGDSKTVGQHWVTFIASAKDLASMQSPKAVLAYLMTEMVKTDVVDTRALIDDLPGADEWPEEVKDALNELLTDFTNTK